MRDGTEETWKAAQGAGAAVDSETVVELCVGIAGTGTVFVEFLRLVCTLGGGLVWRKGDLAEGRVRRHRRLR